MSIFIWEPATDGKGTHGDAAESIQNMLARRLAVTGAVKVPGLVQTICAHLLHAVLLGSVRC